MSRSSQPSRNAQETPILVTGSHRSGSTWVGRMLALDPSIGYLHEPFRPDLHGDLAGPRIQYWNRYITDENEEEYVDRFARTLQFRYDPRSELAAVRRPKDVLRMGRDVTRFMYHLLRGARPLMKDPGAFFSAEWLARRFGMEVVLLIRHPAAFAGSLKRLDWTYEEGFQQLLKQPILMRDYLDPFEDEIRAYAQNAHSAVEQAALLWRIFAHLTKRYRKKHPGWLLRRHEDLSRQPVDEFKALYQELGLDFTSKIEDTIREHTRASNDRDAPKDVAHHMKRDSRSNIWTWKDRLTKDEVSYLRQEVGEDATPFYEEEDW